MSACSSPVETISSAQIPVMQSMIAAIMADVVWLAVVARHVVHCVRF